MIIFTVVVVVVITPSLTMASSEIHTSTPNSAAQNLAVTLTLSRTLNLNLSLSPCAQSLDRTYGGIMVNCQRQNISFLPLPPQWIPLGTSSLLLDFNWLVYLNTSSFSTFRNWAHLRYLGLSHNSISYIEPFTFSQFVSLEKLDLNDNLINLDNASLTGHEFDGLDNLAHLYLADNDNKHREGIYPESLLNDLKNLKSLALDTFKGNLNFGNIFNASKLLSNLYLGGGMTRIKNESFESFSFINLTKLSIYRCKRLKCIETGAFRYLENLKRFELFGGRQGPRNSLESLAPFVNKNMTYLNFSGLIYHRSDPNTFAKEGLLTKQMTRYVSQICVENFALTKSGIYMIEGDSLVNSIWSRCLQTFDLTENPIQGGTGRFYEQWSRMSRLEVFKMTKVKSAFYDDTKTIWQPPSCLCQAVSSRYTSGKWKAVKEAQTQSIGRDDINKTQSILTPSSGQSAFDPRLSIKFKTPVRGRKRELQGTIIVYFPRRLRMLVLNGMLEKPGRLSSDTEIRHGNSTEELHISDNRIFNFTGSHKGLPNLKVLDISRNIGSLMSPTFFNFLSSLVHLNMAKMTLDYRFMEKRSSEVFSPLHRLQTLILSRNNLRDLSKDTFKSNPELRVLHLDGNRFELIPFDLSHVPRLCWLDLSSNALRELSERDRSQLERHTDKVQSFYLSLRGNEFHCGCHSIRFLSWLRRTPIRLDEQGNYSCTLDSGHKTSTGRLISDLEAMWRKCNGETSFWLSLVLSCLMTSAFFFFIVTFKFKRQLKVFLLKRFWPPFIMKTPSDYRVGVYIGYADSETNLACHALRRFIEKELGLTTYVRHRDLLPASDMAESIVEAIHSSWRVLFVVSDHFLADPWSYFALKASMTTAQVENPGRIVLIFTDGDDKHESLLCQLPSCLVEAVREESLVTMTSRGEISYENKQALVTALLYQGSFFDH